MIENIIRQLLPGGALIALVFVLVWRDIREEKRRRERSENLLSAAAWEPFQDERQ